MKTSWFGGREATRLLAAVAATLAMTATVERLSRAGQGLHPELPHAIAAGVLVWLLSHLRRRATLWIASAVIGGLIAVASTFGDSFRHTGVAPSSDMGILSACFGGLCGLLCTPLPDALLVARAARSLDANRNACSRIGVWTLCAGALLVLLGRLPTVMPAITIVAGLLGLVLISLADQRDRRWLNEVHAGRSPNWSLAPAENDDIDLPPIWSRDDFAGLVLAEQITVAAGPYRSLAQRRPIGRVSWPEVPAGVRRRLDVAIGTASAIGVLLIFVELCLAA